MNECWKTENRDSNRTVAQRTKISTTTTERISEPGTIAYSRINVLIVAAINRLLFSPKRTALSPSCLANCQVAPLKQHHRHWMTVGQYVLASRFDLLSFRHREFGEIATQKLSRTMRDSITSQFSSNMIGSPSMIHTAVIQIDTD